MLDFSGEIKLQTTRSGGKGGQNVNKVETAVIGFLQIGSSSLLTPAQKDLVTEKLSNRLNKEGSLVVKAQSHRTQLSNKAEVIERINSLVQAALVKKKMRIATKVSKGAIQARIENKKRNSDIKSGRKKFRPGEF